MLAQNSRELTKYQKHALIVQSIMDVASTGELEVIKKYHKDGFDIRNISNFDDRTMLHQSVLYNQTETVKYLVDHQIVEVTVKDRWGMTPLDYVSSQSIRNLLLLDRKVNVTLTNNSLVFPAEHEKMPDVQALAFYAAKNGDVLTINMLMNGKLHLGQANDKVSVDFQDSEGRTLMMIAASEGKT